MRKWHKFTNAFHLAAKQKHTFKDVPNPFWAENAISAVQSNGIADGTGTGILNRMAQ